MLTLVVDNGAVITSYSTLVLLKILVPHSMVLAYNVNDGTGQ